MRIFKKTPEDLKAALGQCLWIGINGTTTDESLTREMFRQLQPGGVVLFQRNVESIEQAKTLNADLQKQSSIPLFLAIDQEGGVVERLHPLIGSIPPAMALAAAGSRRLTRQLHRAHANLLSALGFNVNFTPVLDLALTGGKNGLGTRCFSDDPRIIVRFAREVIRAHEEAGVLVCGKHFPGLGDTDLDSHLDLPTVSRPWKTIVREDLLPYRKLLSHLPFIMVNHALYPEQNRKLPASLSREITNTFLLTDWSYTGLAVSDDLYMGAVSNLYNLPEAVEKALLAGNHLVLICKPDGVVDAYKKVLARAKRNEALAKAIFHASSRTLSFKFSALTVERRPSSIKREMKRLSKLTDQVSQRAITLLSGNPIRQVPESCTLFLPHTKWVNESESGLESYLEAQGSRVTRHLFPTDISAEDARSLARQSGTEWNWLVVVNTTQHPGQMQLVHELLRQKKRVALISGSLPHDPIPERVQVAVASYWTSHSALQAAGLVLVGERKARGTLPLSTKTR